MPTKFVPRNPPILESINLVLQKLKREDLHNINAFEAMMALRSGLQAHVETIKQALNKDKMTQKEYDAALKKFGDSCKLSITKYQSTMIDSKPKLWVEFKNAVEIFNEENSKVNQSNKKASVKPMQKAVSPTPERVTKNPLIRQQVLAIDKVLKAKVHSIPTIATKEDKAKEALKSALNKHLSVLDNKLSLNKITKKDYDKAIKTFEKECKSSISKYKSKINDEKFKKALKDFGSKKAVEPPKDTSEAFKATKAKYNKGVRVYPPDEVETPKLN